MNKAEIIFVNEGYAISTRGGWKVNSSNMLVKSDNILIVCDPGCNKFILDNSFNANNLSYSDVDFVFLSHNHIDHILLAGLFDNAKIISYENYFYDKDNLSEINADLITKDIKRIHTPGHCNDHYSLLINTNSGVYCFAGDVFWFLDNEISSTEISKVDPLVSDEEMALKLQKSRDYILKNSDIIIPGHGKQFHSKKQH